MTDLRRHVPPLTLVWDDEAPGALHRTVDGTLVFADVSGFTALTERLSRQGRIGAEEIVEALNRVFGPMLHDRGGPRRRAAEVRRRRPALPLPGREPPRAGLRRRGRDAGLAARGRRRADLGRAGFSLSMSVGVHSGDIELFLVGSPTRELLVLGPGATAVPIAEKAAEAGQVVVSPATAARLPAGSHPPARRRRAAAAPPLRTRTGAGSASRPPDRRRAAAHALPDRLGEYLAPGPPDPEHRVATHRLRPVLRHRRRSRRARARRRWPRRCTTLVSTVEEALEAEGVTLLATDLDTDGGKFFLGSGVPTTREDDEGRMLRALRRIADADLPLPLQLGVNRGPRLRRRGRRRPGGPPTPRWATRRTPRRGSRRPLRRARSTPTPPCSSTPARCSR